MTLTCTLKNMCASSDTNFILLLKYSYFQNIIPSVLKYSTDNTHKGFSWKDFDTGLQQTFLEKTFKHSILQKTPPCLSFQVMFLKKMISSLEDNGVDVLDELYEIYTDLIKISLDSSGNSYITYFVTEEQWITLHESVNIVSKGTTGLCTWQAALRMAEWSLSNKVLFQNQNVLELGSGVGLLGLVLATYCKPKHFVFSDCHPEVFISLQKNIAINWDIEIEKKQARNQEFTSKEKTDIKDVQVVKKCESSDCNPCVQNRTSEEQIKSYCGNHDNCIEVCDCDSLLGRLNCDTSQSNNVQILNLDWTDYEEEKLKQLSNWVEVIIAADVVYDKTIIPSLVTVLHILLTPRKETLNPVAYIASTIRNQDTTQAFLNALEERGLSITVLDDNIPPVFLNKFQGDINIIKISN